MFKEHIANNKGYLRPVSSSIKIKASSKQVWEVISKPGNLGLCHPFCESNPVEQWPGNQSIDYVHYYNGLKYQRIFTSWIDGVGYDLLIGRVNGRQSKILWRIHKSDDTSCELRITVYPHRISRYQNVLRPYIFQFYVRPMLRKYLSSVLKGFQWYTIQRQPVQKNQFGVHKWFSY